MKRVYKYPNIFGLPHHRGLLPAEHYAKSFVADGQVSWSVMYGGDKSPYFQLGMVREGVDEGFKWILEMEIGGMWE